MKFSLNIIGKMCPGNAQDCTDLNLDFTIFRGSIPPDPPIGARKASSVLYALFSKFIINKSIFRSAIEIAAKNVSETFYQKT